MPVFRYSLGGSLPSEIRGGAVTIGNFDGVHRGHQALLAETIRQAGASPSVAVTFDPPPAQILRPESFSPPVTPLAYRAELLQANGVTHVLILETSRDLLNLDAPDFFDRILRDGLQAKAVVEGFNFGFGHNRAGTGPLLEKLGKQNGMAVALLPAQSWQGQPVSSSRVRELLGAGQVAEASALLGRPHRLFGTVGKGDQRGRAIGFPTANLTSVANLVPGPGVYAASASWRNRTYAAAAHLGRRPTFGDLPPSVEIHLLDFSDDLYGQDLAVDFFEKLREPMAFASADELKRQIEHDVARVRAGAGN